MAKAGVIAVFTFALGVMTLWGPCMLLQAFVPATLRPGHALQAPVVGASGASAQGLPYANLGAATFAMSMVAALATGRLLAARGQRRAIAPVVACRADTRGLPVYEETYEGDKKVDPRVMARFDIKPEVYAAAEVAMQGGPFCSGLIGGESAFSSGDYNFDPLNLAGKFPDALPWFREAELKHGRICMLAWVGLVVPEIVRIPGPETCYSAANVIEAHAKCVGQPGDVFAASPLSQVLMFVTMVECCTILPKAKQGITIENAGDYQLGLNFLPKDAAKAKEMKLKELKNGRLAMMGFGGAITQAVLSGNGFPWLY